MNRYSASYYEPPEVPYCIIGKVSWGVVQALRVPEEQAHLYVNEKHGFEVLIRDTDFPVAIDDHGTMPVIEPIKSYQRNPIRSHQYRKEADFWKGEDGA